MTEVIIPPIKDQKGRLRPGPASLAWLEASPAFRNGRAQIREVTGANLESTGHLREADAQFRIATEIRRGDSIFS
jgi:hypothetical protein